MSDKKIQVENLYEEGDQWVQNLGDETIHAKRMGGKFRNFKWIAIILWTPFFIGPYLTWNDKQAILFDMENRQYHLFDITIFPQDIWMLTMVLLFLAILLAAMTTVLGRVFCGYFCFQTIWTDIFTWVENKIEGAPAKRRKLDKAPMSFNKLKLKLAKHLIWIAIALFSGVTWMLYFGVTWADYFNAEITATTLAITVIIALGAYVFAGFMREQSCMWVCPYARIQGAMVDEQSIMPTYDYYRGEQRGKLKRGEFVEGNGDCIDCNQCVAVCPTGVDIRKGQEYGCITCGLCIDACDAVMEKVGKPKGLIKYTSLAELEFKQTPKPLYKRPRVIVYSTILLAAIAVLVYGMSTLASMDLKVLHDRSPLFVKLSDGSYRNKYELKVMNKTDKDMQVAISFDSSIKALKSNNPLGTVTIPTGNVKSIFVYLSAYEANVGEDNEVTFVVKGEQSTLEYDTTFFTPKSMR
ncbi:MAG: cytochrome c oxidase accessory protein CcoG [Candidatus Thioglobus sp.]|nr:cytochrome c oxidase accessory protein CcoG [Candidatus Thioglobus pontius]MBL6977127.1 cytochrome c oxidase accessory protein CcoG [Candidatus Thioglobus sp.]MBL6984928.1 cytochrome c oxidase accessory protein CcoG [Candidatus Thioglobus sp.]